MIVLSNLDEMIPVKCNTEDQAVFSNMEYAVKLDLPWLQVADEHVGIAVIVGGGPSVRGLLPMIAAHQSHGAKVFALNGTLPMLKEAGIEPDYFVLLDARAENSTFIDQNCEAHNLIASQCHPSVFEALKDKRITLWHPNYQGVQDYIGDRECALIGGGTTVGLQAVSISYAIGFRKIHLYGFDSSYADSGEGHAYPQSQNDDDIHHSFVVNGKTFIASAWMARQAMEFQDCANQLAEGGTEIYVHGYGLLPTIARELSLTTLTAVYDLSVSPPTYEFLSFLHEAEKARIADGYARLNIVFQPGSNNGFRDDKLPPSVEMRRSMLWRVCVAAARLLPSVSDISVLRTRQPIEGDVFPGGWAINKPVSHYGPSYCKDLQPVLKASEIASDYVGKHLPEKFAVITLRSANHWPKRNSDMDAWLKVSRYLERNGIMAVFIPDEDGELPPGAYRACHEAFWDIDLRAALYEKAMLSLGVSNGTTVLMGMTDCNYLIFDKPDASYPCGKNWLSDVHGFGPDPQYSNHGRVVWGKGDNPNLIISEIAAMLYPALSKTA